MNDEFVTDIAESVLVCSYKHACTDCFSVVYVQFAATAGTFLAAEMGDCQFEAINQ